MVCWNIFKVLSIPNHKSWGAEILREFSTPPCVTCQVSYVMCQVSRVRCQVSYVTFFPSSFFKASVLWPDAFYKSKCLSVRLWVRLFTFEVPFNGLFAPTSQSRMSNNFKDSESLGKSNGKKGSQIWTFLFGSGLKSLRIYFFCCCWFCLTKHGGNHASRCIRDLWSKGISLILAYL